MNTSFYKEIISKLEALIKKEYFVLFLKGLLITLIIALGLFVLFSLITHFTVQHYGTEGLNILSYIVGFTDIDPFLLNLFQGKYEIAMNFIAKASLQAIISNNILKSVFTVFLADSHTKKAALAGMGIVTAVNLILVFLI